MHAVHGHSYLPDVSRILHGDRQPPSGLCPRPDGLCDLGIVPLYFKLLERIPAVEIIVQRAVWSALFGAVLLLFWKHPGWWRELRQNPQRFVVLAASGLLIASNWMTYVWAVNNGHMLEASLGYYINPLINVMLGMLLLKERLRPLQWLAVALASLGVAQQVWQLGSLPWVSLVLALTFGFYGLIRKRRRSPRYPDWWWKPGCCCHWRWSGCCCSPTGRPAKRLSGAPRKPCGWSPRAR